MYIVKKEETGVRQPIWEVWKNFFFFLYYIHMARVIKTVVISIIKHGIKDIMMLIDSGQFLKIDDDINQPGTKSSGQDEFTEKLKKCEELLGEPNEGKEFTVDPTIKGGLQMYTETEFMDMSLSSRIEKLKTEVSKLIE